MRSRSLAILGVGGVVVAAAIALVVGAATGPSEGMAYNAGASARLAPLNAAATVFVGVLAAWTIGLLLMWQRRATA
jgi:hypothetical protein